MSEQGKGQEQEQARPAIVLTDAPPRRSASDQCPGCGRGPKEREASNGFGHTFRLICVCGHQFEETRRV